MPPAERSIAAGFAIGDASEVLDTVIRHSGDCVHVVDLDGRILRWNATCEAVYGWAARDVLGEVLPLVAPNRRRRVIQDIRRVAGTGVVTDRVGTAVRPDGSIVRSHMSIIPVGDHDGDPSGVLVISREILEDDRMDRHRSELAAYVGERLAGPLNVIANAAALLTRPDVSGDDARRQKLAAVLQKHALSAQAFIDDILTTTLVSTDRLVLDREPVDISEIVSAAASELDHGRYPVVMEFDPQIGLVLADRGRLARAFRALFEGAQEAAGERGRIVVSLAARDDAVHVVLRAEGDVGGENAVPILGGPGPDGRVRERLVTGIVHAHGGSVNAHMDPEGDAAAVVVLPLERGASSGADGPDW